MGNQLALGVRLRDGSARHLVLHPRPSVARADGTSTDLVGGAVGTTPVDLPFWGRGISTTWHLSIEDSEITSNHVDLAHLSEIRFDIGYQSFLVNG